MISEITIGDIVIPNCHSIKVSQSINSISDTATITIARNYRELKGHPIMDYIKQGYRVVAKCGYKETGGLNTEFVGFVKYPLGEDAPVVIECDQAYPLRFNTTNISERQISLKSLLERIAPDYKIDCPNTNMGKVLFSKKTPFGILNEIREKYGFFTRILAKEIANEIAVKIAKKNGIAPTIVDRDILTVGFAYGFNPSYQQNHEYMIGGNVKNAKDLKFQNEEDMNVRAKSKVRILGREIPIFHGSTKPDAKILHKEVNPNLNPEEGKNVLVSQYHKVVYTGFTGSIVGFGVPVTRAGDTLTIIDKKHPQRDGTYMIEQVELAFEPCHIERVNTLSFKI